MGGLGCARARPPIVWLPGTLTFVGFIVVSVRTLRERGLRDKPGVEAETEHLRELSTWGRALLVASALAILSELIGEAVYNVSPSRWGEHVLSLEGLGWLEPVVVGAAILVLATALASGRPGPWWLALALYPALLVLGFVLGSTRVLHFGFLVGPVSIVLVVANLLMVGLCAPWLARRASARGLV